MIGVHIERQDLPISKKKDMFWQDIEANNNYIYSVIKHVSLVVVIRYCRLDYFLISVFLCLQELLHDDFTEMTTSTYI